MVISPHPDDETLGCGATLLKHKNKKDKISNQNLQCKVKWSAFDGKEIIGWPVTTIVNGKIVYDQGNLREPAGKEIVIYS